MTGDGWNAWACSGARSIPCTSAHVVVATETRAQLGLDRVLLVVAGDPWQKRGRVVASAADRLALVERRGRRRRRRRGVGGRDRARRAVGHRRHARGADARPTASCSSCWAPTRSPTWARGGGSRRPATSPPWWSWSGPATPTPSRRARGGGWSGCRSRASTSRRPTCGTGSRDGRPDRRPGAPRRRARHPRSAASTLAGDDASEPSPLDLAADTVSPRPAGLRRHRRAGIAAHAAADKKGDDIVVLDVGDIISIAEVFVIVERVEHPPGAHDRRRGRARAQAAPTTRHRAASRVSNDATWVLMDYGDVIVHVFLAETRAFYDLDRLWADAPAVDWEPLAASPNAPELARLATGTGRIGTSRSARPSFSSRTPTLRSRRGE